MRVLMLTNMYPQPDAPWLGVYVKREVEALRDLGAEVDVMVVEGWKNRREYIRAIPRLQRALAARRYDVVHAYYGLMAVIANRQKKVPFVVTFCGDDALGRRRSDGSITLFSKILVSASMRAARNAAAVLVKTDQMKGLFPGDPPVSVIPSGVDLGVFRPLDRVECCRALGLDDSTYKVLFLGDTSLPVKNFPLAERVMGVLGEEGTEVEMLNPTNVSEESVALHMNACDALLITSFSEGSPNIAVEAMACNLPIVSVEVGDIAGLIAGVEGCRLADRDVGPLANALAEVLSARRRTNGSQSAAHLDLSRVALRIMDVYRSVVPQGGRS
jgi:glycosyltransferase involved in cell wall biosynthesis